MSDFAIVNLDELEDGTGGRFEGLEGRFARKHLESRDLGVSRFTYAPGFRGEGGHTHREQEEAYVVVSGSGRVLLDGEAHPLKVWDVLRVAPSVVRAFEAGAGGLELIAIGGPKPEGGDGEPHPVTWPD
jgi:mannose-6-phosphate isomerase-like protein (cupin superfamily)